MMAYDSPDHRLSSEELVVDCGYTRVIATRVGAFGSSFIRAAKPGDFIRAKREKPPRDADSDIPRLARGKMREFTLKELGKATDNFSDKRLVGRGGFGKVIMGKLSDGAVVAVKVLTDHYSHHNLEQFLAEMWTSYAITGIDHPNLVPAIGYHYSRKRERNKIMIVFPFMANGDVRRYLGDRRPSSLTPLDWPTRKRMTLGVARGICSLHQLGIVHRDIKSSNILLDDNFDARVGDFGLSLYADMTLEVVTQLCGTTGYIAPELVRFNGHFSRKSDVYAFGVTLIEIVTGQQVIVGSEEGSCRFLVSWAEQLRKTNDDLTRLMHPTTLDAYDKSEAMELIRLGLICTQYDPEKRPLMEEVIAIMEGSSDTLKWRWDNYECWTDTQWWNDSHSETGAGGSEGGDEGDDSFFSSKLDVDENELEENADDRNLLQQAEDFVSGESNKEYRSGNVGHQLHGYLSGVPCCNTVQPGGAESTSLAISRSLENAAWTENTEVDQNERGTTSKLREVLDEMREMELKHQAAMEEMHEKQIALMQSMIKMQGEYLQKVNEMQGEYLQKVNEMQGEYLLKVNEMQGEYLRKVNEMQSRIDRLQEASQKL